jgi:hypothetical protein
MMTNDLGSFSHALLQLEVASLAHRDGWQVTLEPRTEAGRADVIVQRGQEAFLIEAKAFGVDQTTNREIAASDRLSEGLRSIERSKHVSISGDIDSVSEESGR